MREPSLRSSRLIIAGGLVIVMAAGATGFLAGRATGPRTEPEPEPTSQPAPSPTAEPPRILDRGRLVDIVDRAADLTASGLPLGKSVTDLVGRRFEVTLPFGCDGPAPRDSKAPMRWNYDDEEKTLRVHVSARTWNLDEWGFGEGQERDTAAEGFWINRPWSSSETCPRHTAHAVATAADPVTLPGQTLAIAQIAQTGAATGKPPAPRSFDTVKRIVGEQLDTSRGLRMRLSGRIDRMPNGQPIACVQPAGYEQRPICLVAVSFEEVALEGGVAGKVLATWSLGKSATAN